jgi:hypothetical protein
MALRTAAVLLAGGAVVASGSSGVCPDATSPYMGMVTNYSPACFEECSDLCPVIDGLITEYMATFDMDSMKTKVCAAHEPFSCMYKPDIVDECKKVLQAGAQVQFTLPLSQSAFDEECGISSGGGSSGDSSGGGSGGTASGGDSAVNGSDGASGGLRGSTGHHDVADNETQTPDEKSNSDNVSGASGLAWAHMVLPLAFSAALYGITV